MGESSGVGGCRPTVTRARPRRRGAADDPDFQTTAIEEACWCGHLEVLKRLKPNRGDNLEVLLDRAALSANRDVLGVPSGPRCGPEQQSRRRFNGTRGVPPTPGPNGLLRRAWPLHRSRHSQAAGVDGA